VLSRFQEWISIPLPDFEARERLLTVLLQKKRLAFDVAEGARACCHEGKGMSGRDLESWVSRAERKALPRAIAAGGPAALHPDGRRLRLTGDGNRRLWLSGNPVVSLDTLEVESAYDHPSDGRDTACHTHHGPRSSVERRGVGAMCRANDTVQFERTREGAILMNPPAGGFTSRGNASVSAQLYNWWESHGKGMVFDSNGGFYLPDARCSALVRHMSRPRGSRD
jgi:hypothetical protein